MRILLDTTVLIDVLRGRQDRKKLLADLADGGNKLATATINIAEVYAGLRPAEGISADLFLADLEIYPFTATIARHAGELKNQWARKGRTLELPDTIVAATALAHGLTLMTDNRKDFPMPELRLYDLP